MLVPGGTGVSTYAEALHGALQRSAGSVLVLRDRGEEVGGRGAKAQRLLRAARPGGVVVQHRGDDLISPDVFRVAQVHFDLYRRPLRVRVPGRAGIMHWTYPVPLWIEGWRNIFTVHDAIPLEQPLLTPIDAARHVRLLRSLTRVADGIVTVSEDSRVRLVRHLECDLTFIHDCGQVVEAAADHLALPSRLRAGGYLLFCGSIEPRKNLERLADAHRLAGIDMPLVLAGPIGWQGADIGRRLERFPHLVLLPYQTRPELLSLLAQARGLLFPSLAEGFGLPVAEAMVLGVPVMTSHAGALAETAGDAALLVDPLDVQAMAHAIRAIALDDTLAARLAARGRARASFFSAAAFDRRIAACHAAVLAAPSRGH